MAVDKIPTVGPGGCGGALPGEVVAHPVDADVSRSPALGSLPYHCASKQLGVQGSLDEDNENVILSYTLLLIYHLTSSDTSGPSPLDQGR